jgi:hypothetical protein
MAAMASNPVIILVVLAAARSRSELRPPSTVPVKRLMTIDASAVMVG